MAKDLRGRKLPKGIRQRGKTFEGRVTTNGKTHSVRGKTVTETEQKLTELRYKLSRGIFAENTRATFDEWFHIWLDEYRKLRIKIGTYETYRQFYKSLIFQNLGSIPLCSIRSTDIQILINHLAEKGYAYSTIKIVFSLINSSLRQAMYNGMLERNPAASVQLPRRKLPEQRRALTKEQQKIFSEFSKESKLYEFFAVLLRTGLRNGELRGLKFSDIDLDKNVLHVRRTIKYLDGRGYFEDTPKTNSSLRDIPLTPDIIRLLYSKKDISSPADHIFKGKNSSPLGRDLVQTELNSIIKNINSHGYEFEHITPHVFRHTFATRAIEAGMSPQVLKTILGHSSLAMTMDLYSHVMPETRASEMEKISGAF